MLQDTEYSLEYRKLARARSVVIHESRVIGFTKDTLNVENDFLSDVLFNDGERHMKFKTSCLKIEKEKLFLPDPNLIYHQIVNPKVNSYTQDSKSVTMSPKKLSL